MAEHMSLFFKKDIVILGVSFHHDSLDRQPNQLASFCARVLITHGPTTFFIDLTRQQQPKDMDAPLSQDTNAGASHGDSGCAAATVDHAADQREPVRATTPAPRVIKPAAGCCGKRSLGEYLFFLVMACAISIIVVSVMRPVPSIPASIPPTVHPPVSAPIAAHAETMDHSAPSKWCWCRALDADGRMSKKCVAGSPEEDYCICRCPTTEAQTKPAGLDNFLERAAFAFVLLSLPFVLAAMVKYDFYL
nr:hypothetical protein [Pandoravirus aubagnensis]